MRVAAIQMEPKLGDVEHNLTLCTEAARVAVSRGAELLVYPECALTGYMFSSFEDGMDVAQSVPGASLERLEAMAHEHSVYAIVGTLERDGGRLYNSAVVVGPEGVHATYRKTHLLCLGVDRFTSQGNAPYAVYDLPIGRVGVLICYDLRFPEAARTLALLGAQVIALPTNWPRSSTIMPEVFARSRAAENRVYVVAADRVGTEGGATFLGRSVIVAPNGDVIEEAGMHEAEVLIADLDLADADRKHVVFSPGEHEMDGLKDRRPDLYRVGDARPAGARST